MRFISAIAAGVCLAMILLDYLSITNALLAGLGLFHVLISLEPKGKHD